MPDDSAKEVNIQGPEGETIFASAKQWCMTPELGAQLQERVDRGLDRVFRLHDDRLLVLIGALLIEQAVGDVLEAIMPGYTDLDENRDFSFSMKISVLRALRLVPTRVLTSADLIRDVRNKFAHHLSTEAFTDLPRGKLQALKDRVREYCEEDSQTDDSATLFRSLVSFTGVALFVYAEHVRKMNEYLRDEQFRLSLRAFHADKRGG